MIIKCPYCFDDMNDDEVHFRAEFFTTYEDCPLDMMIDPEEYKPGANPAYDNWLFFKMYDEAEDDPLYDSFWSELNGTTEYNPADEILGIKGYKRKIIDPKNPEHQKYLVKQPDGGYLIRNQEEDSEYETEENTGMVSQIELESLTIGNKHFNRTRCACRVCPHCHNPLPQNYGKFPVKYTTVIGITGAGKTVYISKLLENLAECAPKVGLSALVATPSARNFIHTNPVQFGKPMPTSTPADSFQQPVFYDIIRNVGNDRVIKETFVLYDVAGEVFTKTSLIGKYFKYIENSDGLILLVDPMSIRAVAAAAGREQQASAMEVLAPIHQKLKHNKNNKCIVPIAICIPKCDQEELQQAFGSELSDALRNDVQGLGIPGSIRYKNQFNASDYNRVAENLHLFLKNNERALMASVDDIFSKYAYFAFTALGCGTDENNRPAAAVTPRRIEEPLFWLFHQFKYIGTDKQIARAVPKPRHCPKCGTPNTEKITQPAEQYKMVRKLFSRTKEFVDYTCNDCTYKWNSEKEINPIDLEDM